LLTSEDTTGGEHTGALLATVTTRADLAAEMRDQRLVAGDPPILTWGQTRFGGNHADNGFTQSRWAPGTCGGNRLRIPRGGGFRSQGPRLRLLLLGEEFLAVTSNTTLIKGLLANPRVTTNLLTLKTVVGMSTVLKNRGSRRRRLLGTPGLLAHTSLIESISKKKVTIDFLELGEGRIRGGKLQSHRLIHGIQELSCLRLFALRLNLMEMLVEVLARRGLKGHQNRGKIIVGKFVTSPQTNELVTGGNLSQSHGGGVNHEISSFRRSILKFEDGRSSNIIGKYKREKLIS
jgi:hypothetical protein